jgi:hypothetical protein
MAFSIISQRCMATATKLEVKKQVKQPFGVIGNGSSRRLRVMAFRKYIQCICLQCPSSAQSCCMQCKQDIVDRDMRHAQYMHLGNFVCQVLQSSDAKGCSCPVMIIALILSRDRLSNI